MPTALETDDVIIVGGGPVGFCLALLLGQQGLAVRVIEKASAIDEDLRASTFHPPTLDMLTPSGVTDELIASGLICPTWQIRLHPSGERAVFDLSVLADVTAHPYRLQCEQWKLARALHKRAAALPNVQVMFDSEAETIVQDDAGVAVTVKTPDGIKTFRAAYVAGCDGARSTVRASAKLDFEGVTYPETTLLATTVFPFEDHLEGLSNVSYCWKEGGNFSLLKVPGRWRVSIYPEEGVPIEEQMTPEALNASLQDIVARPEPYTINESRPYRVHMRIVPNYRAGRVVLAGDAAHVNSPSGGMGLNGGIHDAFELSKVLIDIIQNGADDRQLDLYDRRRRPIAQNEILIQADRNRARMRERDPARRRELLTELQAITGDRARMKTYLFKSSMLEGLRLAAAIS
jgi:2-polyprenyl-6-methoxyphenol hydroxylase-like FAD-dependent oxidoreductase